MEGLAAALLLLLATLSSTNGRGGGEWELLLNSSGVVAMHMTLTHSNTVIMFDQTQAGPSAHCLLHRCPRCNPSEPSCWAHSVEYDLTSGSTRPLVLETDTWCSSGAFLGDGTLLQTGGNGDGARRVRYFPPCRDRACDWAESTPQLLDDARWYASDQVLPEEDRVIVVGGLGSYTYEFVPPGQGGGGGSFELPFLQQTRDKGNGDSNLYPFLHLSTDGNLFVFANQDSILLDYRNNRVVRAFPRMPGGGSRSYPSTGSSVLLPLDHADGFSRVEVMICGGAPSGAYQAARRSRGFLRALTSCGRMLIAGADEEPTWAMEEMPGPRLMSDMLLLPSGDVLLINGAEGGCAGFGRARRPAYSPYLYNPGGSPGRRFSVLQPSTVARMYHSSAIVLPDGRALVAGGNPNSRYVLSGVQYPTELRVEAFSPPYMAEAFSGRRATNLSLNGSNGDGGIKYGAEFGVSFVPPRTPGGAAVEFHAYAPPFATHSISMNQRLLKLRSSGMAAAEGGGWVHAVVVAPPSPAVAPAGYYLLTVVNGGVPSEAIWVRFVRA